MTEAKRKGSITPLWIISLFLTFTEIILGVGVVQTTGGIQIALVSFVISFPILISTTFFLLLWFKPYVLYSPFEFGSAEDAVTFIDAITRDAKNIQQKSIEVSAAAAEIESLRAEVLLKFKELEEKTEAANRKARILALASL
jgi:hypothetical protein